MSFDHEAARHQFPVYSGDGAMAPAFGVTDPGSSTGPRMELRDREMLGLPLTDVVDRLTDPAFIEKQISEYEGITFRGGGDPSHLRARAAHDDGELMLTARSGHGSNLFVGRGDLPEISLVTRSLEDAPRSYASAGGYDPEVLAANTPQGVVLAKDVEVMVNPGDFAFPSGQAELDYAGGYAELRELEGGGRDPRIHALAMIQPDGTVVYVHRGGNVSLAAVSQLRDKVMLTQVAVFNGDAAKIMAGAEDGEESPLVTTTEVDTDPGALAARTIDAAEDIGGANDWRGREASALRKRSQEDDPTQAPVPGSWFMTFMM